MTAFDWSKLASPYGEASGVPGLVASAEADADALGSLELIESAAVFVLDAGSLNEGASVLARELLGVAARRLEQGCPAWPFLRGVLRIVAARAVLSDHFGLAPLNRIAPAADERRSGEQRLVYQAHQQRLADAVDDVVRSEWRLLDAALRAGGAEERAAAIVLSVSCRAPASALLEAADAALASEPNPVTRAALLLGLSQLREGGDRIRALIAADLHAGAEELRRGAAVAALWRLAEFRGERALIVDDVRGALTSVDARPPLERFDYGWHDELACGEAARAVYGSGLDDPQKRALLMGAVQAGPRIEHEDGFSTTNAATPAAWFLLRLSLSRHYHRTTLLGPEDLTAGEREVLECLALHRTWMFDGGDLIKQFGVLAPFDEVAPRLLRRAPDALDVVQSGAWQQRAVEWSRWKWLRAALDQTAPKSDARAAGIAVASRALILGCELSDAVEIVRAAANDTRLPVEPLLLELFARLSRAARPPAFALAARTSAASSPRVDAVERLLEAAFGASAPPPATLQAALAALQASPALEQALAALAAAPD